MKKVNGKLRITTLNKTYNALRSEHTQHVKPPFQMDQTPKCIKHIQHIQIEPIHFIAKNKMINLSSFNKRNLALQTYHFNTKFPNNPFIAAALHGSDHHSTFSDKLILEAKSPLGLDKTLELNWTDPTRPDRIEPNVLF